MRSVRWSIAVLITVAVAIGYLDRQALAVSIKAIEADFAVSDQQFGILQTLFFMAYACMYMGGGRLMDALGTRRGFFLIMVWWSLACAAHGLADGFGMLAAGRLMLGLALGGTFPAGAKAIAEWFPSQERSTAMGMINGGGSVGAVIAPPLFALVLAYLPWPWVFYLSGALGLVCAAWWLYSYHPASEYPRLSPKERDDIHEVLTPNPHQEAVIPWRRLFTFRQVWGMMLGKGLSDAVWFTYIAWLPKYFLEMRDFSTAEMGSIVWIPYAASGIGSFIGGWASSILLRSGYSLSFSRKAVLTSMAVLMPCMWLVTRVPPAVEIAVFSTAMFAHLAFATIIITLPADLFPRRVVASVVGLIGFGGAMGGAILNYLAGQVLATLGRAAGYPVLFGVSSTFHLLGLLCLLVSIRNVRPVELPSTSSPQPAALSATVPSPSGRGLG